MSLVIFLHNKLSPRHKVPPSNIMIQTVRKIGNRPIFTQHYHFPALSQFFQLTKPKLLTRIIEIPRITVKPYQIKFPMSWIP